MTYIPGDWKMICDRCGSTFLRSQMAEEWTGLWVCTKGCFQTRHPQDFVESVPDDPSVPVSRPDVVQSVGETTLSDDMTADTKRVFIVCLTGLAEDDPIGIETNYSKGTHWSFIEDLETLSGDPLVDSEDSPVLDADGETVTAADGYSGYICTLNTSIFFAADMGNAVYLPSLNNEEWQ